MRFYPVKKQAQSVDVYTQEIIGIPGMVLIEKAAERLALRLEESLFLEQAELTKKKARILAVVERGNNGGDAIAAMRILKTRGYDTYIYEIGGISHTQESYIRQVEIAEKLGVGFLVWDNIGATGEDYARLFSGYDVIVDGIFGIGLSRDITGIQKTVAEGINESGAYVVGCDIPSGISADNGHIMGTAVRCDMTVTFGYIKYGMLINEGRKYSGKIYCEEMGLWKPRDNDDIGFLYESKKDALPAGIGDSCDISTSDEGSFLYYENDEGELSLPERRADSNKGTYGKVLIIAGSYDIYGALYLSGLACYKSGAGLVKIVTDQINRDVIADKLPEAMMLCYDSKSIEAEEDGEPFWEKYKEALNWADVILIGPGLGQGKMSKKLYEEFAAALTDGKKVVIDADGLNIAASEKSNKSLVKAVKKAGRGNVYITPHIAEGQRL
ncbi:MAG: NAD(P)H-hydrate epimerase, partial [Lachnospiraceae bacterium]|nr:NAD(P)H-hydrate epimerase [Lachnospiraceae bacterium]